ncbi:sulfatase-like hydrolase/transferase, partial [Thalassospira sp.]
RRAYFANISYIDDKIGDIIDVLERTLQVDNTIILFLSDHGDMLGDRGLWFKMSFFEGSARVPLMMAGPNIKPGSYTDPVSTLDVTPTLAELAGISLDDVMPWTDGISLVPGFSGTRRSEPVLMEYAAEGSNAPLVCIRDGRWKYVHCELDPEQLFDLETDPDELRNLAPDPAYARQIDAFRKQRDARWDMAAFDSAVRESQARRWIVYQSLRNGAYFPWDYQPLQKASERYMRNHMDL